MSNIKNDGKYFIPDSEIKNQNNDKFKHVDFAENIISMIANNEPPFNIAIVGQWGLGKSSLVNFVREYFVTQENYKILEVNAWKYEKEEMRRVLLKRTIDLFGYPEKTPIKDLINEINKERIIISQSDVTYCDHLKKEIVPLIFDSAVIYLTGLLLVCLGTAFSSKFSDVPFNFVEYCKYILTKYPETYFAPMFISLLSSYVKSKTGDYMINITPPMTATDEYEDTLEKILVTQKNEKIIIILDDLDRLTPNKIVETLDAIKAFVDYGNFIFIVPFDDSILKEALKGKKTVLTKNEHLIIESDLFLDKLFQYKVFLPKIIQWNMADYAIGITSQEAPDLLELCAPEEFELLCKQILIHAKVTTPRQVKKIINTFSQNLLLAKRRATEENLSVLVSEEGKKMLAKISVLQADFPVFYKKLFAEPELISDFLELANNSDRNQEIPPYLTPYFQISHENGDNKENASCGIVKTPSGDSLSLFLHKTASVKVDDLAIFLYMDADKFSLLFGNEFSRSIHDGLTSGDFNAVIDSLEKNTKGNSEIQELLYEILTSCDSTEQTNVCLGIICISEKINLSDNIKLITLINDRLGIMLGSTKSLHLDKIQFSTIFAIFNEYSQMENIKMLLIKKVETVNSQAKTKEILIDFFKVEPSVPESIKKSIQELISIQFTENILSSADILSIIGDKFSVFFENYLKKSAISKKSLTNIITDELHESDNVEVIFFNLLVQEYFSSSASNSILADLLPHLKSSWFANLLLPQLIEYHEDLSKASDVQTMCMNVLESEDGTNTKQVLQILSLYKWEISEECAEKIDLLLSKNLACEYTNRILLKLQSEYELEYVSNTIDFINNNIYNQYLPSSTIKLLQEEYTDDQRSELISSLTEPFLSTEFDEEKLAIATSILELISESPSNEDDLAIFAENLMAKIQKTPQPIEQTIPYLSRFSINIGPEPINKAIPWMLKNFAPRADLLIRVIDLFERQIGDSEKSELVQPISEHTTVEVLDISLRLLRNIKKSVKLTAEQLTIYRDFLIKHLVDDNYREKIMNDILKGFSNIRAHKQLLEECVNYPGINSLTIQSMEKFVAPEEVEDCVCVLLENIDSSILPNATIVLKGWLKDDFSKIVKTLITTLPEMPDYNYTYNLLTVSTQVDSITTKEKLSLLEILQPDYEEGLSDSLIPMVTKLGKLEKTDEKKLLGEILYKLFKAVKTTEEKKQIYSAVISSNTKTSFTKISTTEKRDFTDDERSLMRSLNGTKKIPAGV